MPHTPFPLEPANVRWQHRSLQLSLRGFRIWPFFEPISSLETSGRIRICIYMQTTESRAPSCGRRQIRILIPFAQLAQNSGWNTSQMASKGLTRALKPVFSRVRCKLLKLKKAEAIPGSATIYHPLRPANQGFLAGKMRWHFHGRNSRPQRNANWRPRLSLRVAFVQPRRCLFAPKRWLI
jgi:hypothetical protein